MGHQLVLTAKLVIPVAGFLPNTNDWRGHRFIAATRYYLLSLAAKTLLYSR